MLQLGFVIRACVAVRGKQSLDSEFDLRTMAPMKNLNLSNPFDPLFSCQAMLLH